VKGQVSGAITPGSGIQWAAKLILQIKKEKKDFVHSTNFKLLRQKKRNSINHNVFLKLIIYVVGGGGGGGIVITHPRH